MTNSMKVKVLEVLGPTKFSVRPNLSEGNFHSLQRRLDQHYFDLEQSDALELEERVRLSEGGTVRSVVSILTLRCPHLHTCSGSVSAMKATGAGLSSTGSPTANITSG